MTKLIVACSGGVSDLAAIRQLAGRTHTDVIAVVLDFGNGGLLDVHDAARAAGAVRCHVLDVRDEFARDYVLPAIHANELCDALDDSFSALMTRLVEKKLAEVAELEGGEVMAMPAASDAGRPRRQPAPGLAPDRSAQVNIAFEQGVPVSVNGVPMTLLELMDCLSTIASAHGLPGARPEIAVLQTAHHEVAGTERGAWGTARLELSRGVLRTHQPEYATT